MITQLKNVWALMLLIILIIFNSACGSEEEGDPSLAIVKSVEVSEVTSVEAKSGGVIISEGASQVVARGVCWSTDKNPTISNNKTLDGTGDGAYSSILTSLLPDTKYFLRAYATNNSGTAYGDQLEFTTNGISLKEIKIQPTETNIPMGLSVQFTATGTLTDNSDVNITQSVFWQSSDNNVGTIELLGDFAVFTTVAVGTTTVSAASGSISKSLKLTVTPEALVSIELVTDGNTIMPSTTQAINAVGTYTDGSTKDISNNVTWTSSDLDIATIGTSGQVGLISTTSNFGDFTVNASLTDINASLSLSVGLVLGKEYEGGLIFYIDNTGEHGLVAAPSDQSAGVVWWVGAWVYTDQPSITPDKQVGSGAGNTSIIVNTQGNQTYAAKICDDLILNSYSDWFLPAIDELKLMCQNLYESGIGGLSDEFYWSSTDTNKIHNAWWMQFSNGCQVRTDLGRNLENRVRAVRAF